MTETPEHLLAADPLDVLGPFEPANGVDDLHMSAAGTLVTPDTARVIIHFDIDCFYAQVEEVRNPALKGKPVGVTQKYLIVTSNYEARARGVTKLTGIKEALAACPELQLVPGEDLTPYRAASKSIWSLLDKFGKVQHGGLDEAFLDATDEVLRRVKALQAAGQGTPEWSGHVWQGNQRIMADSRHRLQDLRIAKDAVGTSGAMTDAGHAPAAPLLRGDGCDAAEGDDAAWDDQRGKGVPWEVLLRVGSGVAAEARADIARTAGFRTSAGIACNKLMAKLVSGLHKPDDQTVMPPPAAAAFVAPLPVRSLPGVGYKTNQTLAAMEVHTVADMRARPRHELERIFGATQGRMLHLLSMGRDDGAVTPSGPPKAITCEDSFKSCTTHDAAATVLRVIAPDLAHRVLEEHAERHRWPRTVTVKWRFRKAGHHRSGASQPLPVDARPGCGAHILEEAFLDIARRILKKNLPQPFDLTLLNIGVTSFHDLSAPSGVSKISALFHGASRPPAAATVATVAVGDPAQARPAGSALPHGLPASMQPPTVAAEHASAAPLEVPPDGLQLCSARRSYAGADGRAVVSKRQERALMDAKLAAAKAATSLSMPATSRDAQNVPQPGIPASTAKMPRQPTAGPETPSVQACTATGSAVAAATALPSSASHHITSTDSTPAAAPDMDCPAASPAGAAAAATPAWRSADVYSPATAAQLRAAGLIDSDDDCAAATVPRPSAPCASPAAALEVVDVVGDTDEDTDDDDEAIVAAAIMAENLIKAQEKEHHCTVATAVTTAVLPEARACASSSPETPAERAGAAMSTPAPPAAAVATGGTPGQSPDCHTAPDAAGISPPNLAGAPPGPQAASGRDSVSAVDETPVLQQTLVPGAAPAAAAAVPVPQMATYTPGSWGPASAWSLPEHGLPGVVKYEAVDDYDTDRTGSTLNTPDPDVSPAAATPSLPCRGAHMPHAWRTGPALQRTSAADSAPAGPAALGTSPLATVDHASPPVATAAVTNPMRSMLSAQKQRTGSPVVKLPSLRGTMKRPTPGNAGAGSGHEAASAAGNAPAPQAPRAADGPPVGTTHACLRGASPAGQTGNMPEAVPPTHMHDAPFSAPAERHESAEAANIPLLAGGQAASVRVTLPRCGRSSAGSPQISGGGSGRTAGAAPADGDADAHGAVHGGGAPASGNGDSAPVADGHAGGRSEEVAEELPELDGEAGPAVEEGGRVILHVDVDSFYCQVEVLDNPELQGQPLAVQQFNAGGFVAVSYEAKAAGVRKGDGVGAGGRANIPHLQKIGAVSVEEARRRCPGLRVLPMRTERYRAVSDDILAALRAFAADRVVQRQGYDDFYLDAPAAAGGPADVDGAVLTPPPRCRVVIPGADTPDPGATAGWHLIPHDLARGCVLAQTIQDHLSHTLHVSVSVGVARTRLLSRLLSPLNKPRGISVLPPAHIGAFMATIPLAAIPSLGGKAGARLEALGAATVGDLRGIPAADLAAAADPGLLAALERGGLEEDLKDTGPRQSIAVERSFQATELPSQLRKAAAPLVDTLLRRVAADTALHRRLPQKLVASWRNGYGAVRSKTIPVPRKLTTLLRPCLTGDPLALNPPACLANGDMPVSRPSGEAAGNACEGTDGSTEGRGSQGGQAAAAATAALEEVGQAISASVVAQIDENAEQPLRITRISIAATFDAAAATHAAQQCLQAFLSSSAGHPASPPRPPATPCSQEAKLQAFFQAGASPPSRRSLPFPTPTPGAPLRQHSATRQSSGGSPPRPPAAVPEAAPSQRTTAPQRSGDSHRADASPEVREFRLSGKLPALQEPIRPLPAVAASEADRAIPSAAPASAAATIEAVECADAPAPPCTAATGRTCAAGLQATVTASPASPEAILDSGGSLSASGGDALDVCEASAGHPCREPTIAPVQLPALVLPRDAAAGECDPEGSPALSVPEAPFGPELDAGRKPASADVECQIGLVACGPQPAQAPNESTGAAAEADPAPGGAAADGVLLPTASPPTAGRAGATGPYPIPNSAAADEHPGLPNATHGPEPHAEAADELLPSAAAHYISPPVPKSPGIAVRASSPVAQDAAGCAGRIEAVHGGGGSRGLPSTSAAAAAAPEASQGQEADLEAAVRSAHLQSLRGGRHDLDRRLALRLQEEELRAGKRARATPAKPAKAPPRPKKGAKRGRSPPGRRSSAAGRGSGTSGQMQSLDSFFTGKRGR